MRPPILVLRSLAYRWRTNVAVALGVALATGVLVASLGAGDSVRASLRALTIGRLGRTTWAMEAGDRFFRSDLADAMAVRLGGSAAALIVVPGSVSARGGEVRASPVQVLGVDDAFWAMGPQPAAHALGPREVLLSEPLARMLAAGPGDEVIIRVGAGTVMPAEAPLAAGTDGTVALRLTVKAVVGAEAFGSFSLRVNQALPMNAFISREALAAQMRRSGRANTLLLAPDSGRAPDEVARALTESFRLEDAGLTLRGAGAGGELVSDRVFIEPAVEEAALAEAGRGVLTYFVDRISLAGRSISYAFVSSGDGFPAGAAPADGELLLNSWAAAELGAKPADVVEVEYQVPGPEPGSALEQRTERLRVRAVVPIGPGDRSLMPAFPGFAGVENCRDWDPGVPLDLSRIGPRDQEYWDRYGGSPKAFVSLATAERLWGNRFGRLTAVRFDLSGPGQGAERLAERISARLPPRAFGLEALPVREIGLAASGHGVDFGQLFLGLSFFLVAASVLLTVLLFTLSVEQRAADIGTLDALGFTHQGIRWLLLAEAALVALAGSVAGVPLGLAFHRGILTGLATAWKDAVRTPSILPFMSPGSIAAGFAAGLAVSLVTIALAGSRTLGRLRARRRQRPPARRPTGVPAGVAAGSGMLGAAAALAWLPTPTSFFVSGALLLAGLLASGALLLALLGRPRSAGMPTLLGVGVSNACRRATRSLAVASALACGIFVVSAVAANRVGVPDPERRDSGTGGFVLIAETAAPIVAERERRLVGVVTGAGSTGLVGLRVLDGDDASCLNLNRVKQPRMLGVLPSSLAGRFTFTGVLGGSRTENPWALLDQDLGPNTVPGIADSSVITWGLGLELGDELTWLDEAGATLKVRLVAGLANSIFQGSVIVAERALVRHFPSSGGHRVFLVEAPTAGRAALASVLSRYLGTQGASVVSSAERLAQFNSVENAYLAVFALLGWLGMLIGTLGFAVVAARNVAESRGELALLRALGFGRPALLALVAAEHLLPISFGFAAGIGASALAVFPTTALQGAAAQTGPLLVPIAAILALAFVAIVASAAAALRGDLMPALRAE